MQVSSYLKKQMVAAEGTEGGDEVKKMLEENEKLVDEIFQHEDKDKNGFISHEEFSGPKHDELWAELDAEAVIHCADTTPHLPPFSSLRLHSIRTPNNWLAIPRKSFPKSTPQSTAHCQLNLWLENVSSNF